MQIGWEPVSSRLGPGSRGAGLAAEPSPHRSTLQNCAASKQYWQYQFEFSWPSSLAASTALGPKTVLKDTKSMASSELGREFATETGTSLSSQAPGILAATDHFCKPVFQDSAEVCFETQSISSPTCHNFANGPRSSKSTHLHLWHLQFELL